MSRVVIVVPCYNEAARLDLRTFLDFGRRQPSIDFLFVNDGSRDRTLELLELMHQSNPARFSFLHLAHNSGKAEAVRQGMLLALTSRPDYVGFWDADLATPLEDIVSFRRVCEEKPAVDLVLGIRLPLLGRAIERTPVRRLMGRVFARSASLALGLGIYDTQCGAKLFRVTPQVRQAFEQPFLARWTFDVELLARLRRARRAAGQSGIAGAIYEFPLDHWRDVAGSKVKPLDFVKSLFELVRIYWTYLRPGLGAPAAHVAGSPPALGHHEQRTEDEAYSDRQRAA